MRARQRQRQSAPRGSRPASGRSGRSPPSFEQHPIGDDRHDARERAENEEERPDRQGWHDQGAEHENPGRRPESRARPRWRSPTRSARRSRSATRTAAPVPRARLAPAIGALNAVARPAPAPAASNTRQSGQLRRKILPTRWPKVAAMCTLGPSRPSASPTPIASTPPTNFTGMIETALLQLLSENGFDLRDAASGRLGEIQRTSEAAIPAAAAQAATINQTPSGPCA